MSKPSIFVLAAALTLGLGSSSFAEEVQGVVDSMDASNSAVVISDPVSGASRTVRVHPNVLSGVEKGSVVKAKLKSGSNEADEVEVIVAR